MNQIMTADEAFNVYMNKYPLLGISLSEEDAKLRYFDHLFNTTGNGIYNHALFIKEHEINSSNLAFIHSYPEKYIQADSLYYAFKEIDPVYPWPQGKQDSKVKGFFTLDEISAMPGIAIYEKFENFFNDDGSVKEKFLFSPYPNFKKENSLIYNLNFSELDKSWIEAAIWYYNKAEEFFLGENSHLYIYAFPKSKTSENTFKLKQEIEDWKEVFKDFEKEGLSKEEYHKIISNHFKVSYNGDITDFICQIWDIKKKSIIDFIDDSLAYLKQVKYSMDTPTIGRKRKF